MSISFSEGVALTIDGALIEHRNDMSYLGWHKAMSLAALPPLEINFFGENKPYFPIFGGVCVAITGGQNRIYLPVLDENNVPVAQDAFTPRIINDALARCKAKAIAMNWGVGLCLYAGYEGNATEFKNDLGFVQMEGGSIAPSSPKPMFLESGVPYLHWSFALAAAHLSDPEFRWEIETYGDYPYLQIGGGFMVGVKITWRGKEHVELLPIMDNNFDSMATPGVDDWNRAVMRCLTKAIAVTTGYGLDIYAASAEGTIPKGMVPPSRSAPAMSNEDRNALLNEVKTLLVTRKRTEDQMLNWLGQPGKTLEDLSVDLLLKARMALSPATKAAA